MSVGALVRQVGEVLYRGHALFGTSPGPDVGATGQSGWRLGAAGDVVHAGQLRVRGASGAFAVGYSQFGADAGPALHAAADADTGLSRAVHDTSDGDRRGRRASASVLRGAASDTAILAASTRTPTGQRALITALRTRLAEHQHVIDAYQARDARLAAMVRSLRYGQRGGGGMPSSGERFSAGGAGGVPTAALVGGLIPRSAINASPAALSPSRGMVGTPLGALTAESGPREVAAAIIHEARRRGYSPYQTTAILADAMQESHLSPRAKSPNGLWESIFQQDSSYPGRRNPNLAIAEFFNRLDKHGGPSSRDIWRSIFWLQQRPGDPSAEDAYAHGRRAYLAEIQSQHAAAIAMYREIAGAAAAPTQNQTPNTIS